MYQTVIVLLVTAVITIITTVVTVRVTMTGRVISQTAKAKFKATVSRYSIILGNLPNVLINTYLLIRFIRDPRPLDRADVVLAALQVGLVLFGMAGILIGVAYLWAVRRSAAALSD